MATSKAKTVSGWDKSIFDPSQLRGSFKDRMEPSPHVSDRLESHGHSVGPSMAKTASVRMQLFSATQKIDDTKFKARQSG